MKGTLEVQGLDKDHNHAPGRQKECMEADENDSRPGNRYREYTPATLAGCPVMEM